jgi:hypothetical protein
VYEYIKKFNCLAQYDTHHVDNVRAPIDLLRLPSSEMTCFYASQRFEFILKMQETTKLNIEKMNEKYRIAASKGRKEVKLEPGD